MSELDDLEQAVEDLERAKRVVLQILHLNGVIAFDASKDVLDTAWHEFIRGRG